MKITDLSPELREVRGFYPTPRTVVLRMVSRAGGIQEDDQILEPSAGSGAIADVLREFSRHVEVVEPNSQFASLLRQKGYRPHECRFEDFVSDRCFNKILMNPPFAGGNDLLHIRRAFDLLLPGGVVVSLMNAGVDPYDSTPTQKREFAEWLMGQAHIGLTTIEPLSTSLFLSAENIRPSKIPIKMIAIHKIRVTENRM